MTVFFRTPDHAKYFWKHRKIYFCPIVPANLIFPKFSEVHKVILFQDHDFQLSNISVFCKIGNLHAKAWSTSVLVTFSQSKPGSQTPQLWYHYKRRYKKWTEKNVQFKLVMLWKAINNSRQMAGWLEQKILVKYQFLERFFFSWHNWGISLNCLSKVD